MRTLACVLVLVGILAGVLIVRTVTLPSEGLVTGEKVTLPSGNEAVARRLAEAVRIKTISWGPEAPVEAEAFAELRDWLAQTYPHAHDVMSREIAGGHSLLFRWQGSDPALKPVALIAHMDVVPVENGTEDDWTHPPFAGVIEDGYVWGRGTLDDKVSIVTLMEAAERLAAQGFRPERDIYFGFGHDEEIGGDGGAAAIARLLSDRNVRLAYTLDEGSAVIDNDVTGTDSNVALVNIAEKGYLTVELIARAPGGHSSMPPKETAITILAAAITRLSDTPFPAYLDEPVLAFLRAVAPERPFVERMAIANLWLLAPVVKLQMLESPTTAAQLRTTVAATMINGGEKENILPQEARAVVNLRIHPRETLSRVMDDLKETVDDDRIEIRPYGDANNPPEISSLESGGFRALRRRVGEVFAPVIFAPGLTVAGTDSKNYASVSDDLYRFTPYVLDQEAIDSIHGTNERISVSQLPRMVAFYERLIREPLAGTGEE